MKLVRTWLFLALVVVSASSVHAQNLELSAGWAHSTGDFGVDGLGLGAALWFSNSVTLGFNYDTMWDTSRVGSFALTSIGETSIKSHLQNVMAGPRVFLANRRIRKKYSLRPFVEAQFGYSRLNTKIDQVNSPSIDAADDAFTWMLGGGADYVFNAHWAARGNLGILRTHFSDTGQTRLRFVIGTVYTFGRR